MIASKQKINTDIAAFIAVLVFKFWYKQKRQKETVKK